MPQSTNVSSPVQAASIRRQKRGQKEIAELDLHVNGYERDDFVVSDNDDAGLEETDSGEDAFEPIREAGVSRKREGTRLGPPITADHKLERLNPTHRMVVDEFMVHAKRECEKVGLSIDLRLSPMLIAFADHD